MPIILEETAECPAQGMAKAAPALAATFMNSRRFRSDFNVYSPSSQMRSYFSLLIVDAIVTAVALKSSFAISASGLMAFGACPRVNFLQRNDIVE
jgi:hypothetical protein